MDRRRCKTLPEIQIFQDGQSGLNGILMAEIVGLLLRQFLRLAILQADRTFSKGNEPGEGAQERRFADAVGTGHHKGRALLQ